nr:MFS transporter [Paenalcaligenes niemegkensis]
MDLFDLFILLYVAPIIGRLFFPSDQPTLSLAAVYASFAVALLVRPVGSAIFGSYADKHGRKRALLIAMVGVGLATAAFGLLPTIHQVGIVAPILFILLRIVQGIFVGGIVASTHTIGTESISPKHRGLMSGLIGSGGAGMGALMASFAYFVLSRIYPGEAFDEFGWRVMFFSGLISTFFGLIMYRLIDETPAFRQMQADRLKQGASAKPAKPLRTLFFGEYRNNMLLNLLITFGGGATYYITAGYLPTLLDMVAGVSHENASTVLILSSVGTIVGALVFGGLSDKIGRKKTFLLLGVLCLFGLPTLFTRIQPGLELSTITMITCGISVLGGGIIAPVLIFLNERFPTVLRASGTGLSWNIGFALGGMMPTVVSLVSSTPADIPYVLAISSACLAAVYLVGALVTPETQGNFK